MVPEGWKLSDLGSLGRWSGGGTPSKSNPSFWNNGIIPWVSPKDMWVANIDSAQNYITADAVKGSSTKIYPSGSVLVVTRSGILRKRLPVALAAVEVAVNQDLKVLPPNSEVDTRFIANFLWCFNSTVLSRCAKEGTTVESIDTSSLMGFPIKIPPITEQKKIAQILSTWDKAITTTEQLLANSQQQKKALMQQLLTGKKRFSGYENNSYFIREGYAKRKLGVLPSDWRVELIEKHLWFQEGPGVRKHQFTETGVKLFNGTNIQFNKIDLTNTSTHISNDEALGIYKHFLVDQGDLLIACSGISVDRFNEKIAFVSDTHLPLCMNTSTMRFKKLDDGNVDITYFQYFMQSPLFKNQIRRQATGSAQLNFGPSHVGKCFVVIPSIAEQQKIGNALSTVDQEITFLQQKLEGLEQEKKALMQQLLTGKCRVKVDEDAA